MASSLRQRLLALTDPTDPAGLGRTGRISLCVLVLALMLPTLAMELGPDQGIFYIVARKLLGGGLLYRDIVDIKPPLIYHMYAGAIALLGPSAFSIRAMDVVLQLLTCWMLWRLVKRVGGGELSAALAVIVYVLILLAQVAQSETESYTGLFLLPLVWGAGFRRTRGSLLVAGLCAGALTLLKYTLGLSLAGALLLIWFADAAPAARLRMMGWVVLGWALAMLPLVLYLMQPGVLDAYRDVMAFTSGYTASGWQQGGSLIKGLTSTLPWTFNESFSLLFSIAAALGVGMGARVIARDDARPESAEIVRLLRACVLFFLLMLVTIAFEARYTYQFQRVMALVAPLAAFGIVWALRRIAGMPPVRSRALRFALIVGSLATAFYLSPLVTALWRSEAVSIRSIARIMGHDILPQISRDENYVQAEEIASHVRERRAPGDELFVLSGDGGTIYDRCGIMPHMRLMHSAMYTAPFSPRAWREETNRFLVEGLPRFVVVQVGEHGLVTKGSEDVLETMRTYPEVAATFDNHYREIAHTPLLRLFERVQ